MQSGVRHEDHRRTDGRAEQQRRPQRSSGAGQALSTFFLSAQNDVGLANKHLPDRASGLVQRHDEDEGPQLLARHRPSDDQKQDDV